MQKSPHVCGAGLVATTAVPSKLSSILDRESEMTEPTAPTQAPPAQAPLGPAATQRRLGSRRAAVLLAAFVLGVQPRAERLSAVGLRQLRRRAVRIRSCPPAGSALAVDSRWPVTAVRHPVRHLPRGAHIARRRLGSSPPLFRLRSATGHHDLGADQAAPQLDVDRRVGVCGERTQRRRAVGAQ